MSAAVESSTFHPKKPVLAVTGTAFPLTTASNRGWPWQNLALMDNSWRNLGNLSRSVQPCTLSVIVERTVPLSVRVFRAFERLMSVYMMLTWNKGLKFLPLASATFYTCTEGEPTDSFPCSTCLGSLT